MRSIISKRCFCKAVFTTFYQTEHSQTRGTMNPFLFPLWHFQLITESLPISSSGHLRLLDLLWRAYSRWGSKKIVHSPLGVSQQEEHLMHLPTLCILILFLYTYTPLWTGKSLLSMELAWIFPLCITTGITGLMYLSIKRTTLEKFPLYAGFFITGCTLLILVYTSPGSSLSMGILQASILGIAQTCTLLPGISRLAFTYTTGVLLSLNPRVSFLFSLSSECLLIISALAKIALATHKKEKSLLRDLSHLDPILGMHLLLLLVTSYISYQVLVSVAQLCIAQKVFPFAVYMLILALVVLLLEKILIPLTYPLKDRI